MRKPFTYNYPNSEKLEQSVQYVYDASITGFRPVTPSDFGNGGGGTGDYSYYVSGTVDSNVVNFKTATYALNPTLDASTSYASGDVFCATQTAIFSTNPIRGAVKSVTVLDKSNSGEYLDVYFLRNPVSFGTINSSPNVDIVDAESIIGYASIEANKSLNTVKFGQSMDCNIPFDLQTGQFYVAAITRKAIHHQAGDIYIRVNTELEKF